MKSDAIDKLAAALAAAQPMFPSVPKDKVNPFFKSNYADLASCIKVAAPVLALHGLSVAQFPTSDNGEPALLTYLVHSSGQFIAESMPLLNAKADPQAQGSAITYARRYAYCAVLGLVADDDDDGNHAAKVARDAEAPARAGGGAPVCFVCSKTITGSAKKQDGKFRHPECDPQRPFDTGDAA